MPSEAVFDQSSEPDAKRHLFAVVDPFCARNAEDTWRSVCDALTNKQRKIKLIWPGNAEVAGPYPLSFNAPFPCTVPDANR